LLELLQRPTGLEAELANEGLAMGAIGLERLGLPS
jgi:hypothetical protein